MRGLPSQKISLQGGLDAEKQLKKEVFVIFSKIQHGHIFFWMYIIVETRCFRCYNIELGTHRQTDRHTYKIAYYSPAWAVARAGEN